MQIHEFEFRDILSTGETVPPEKVRCGVPFLNLNFRPANTRGIASALRGCGIYAIFFREDDDAPTLIYIGKFRGVKTDPFAGNIASARWWRHAASFSMRGDKIHVSNSIIDKLERHLQTTPHSFSKIVETRSCMKVDKGCLGAWNRIRFAMNHWDRFEKASGAEILSRFKVRYIQLPAPSAPPSAQGILQLRARIGCLESRLIAEFLPRCNDEVDFDTARSDVTESAYLEGALPMALAELSDVFDERGAPDL